MVIAFWIVMPILMYLLIAGVSAKKFQKAVIRDCASCYIDKDGDWMHAMSHYSGRSDIYSVSAHDAAPFLSLVWPVVLPFMLGQFLGDSDTRKMIKQEQKEIEMQTRHNTELEEQKHQLALAKLRAQENELLDKHLQIGKKQDV